MTDELNLDHLSPQLIPGCQLTFRLSDGSIYSIRRRMSPIEWDIECGRAAAHLGIPPEQHQAQYMTEYLVKVIEEPHSGLLGTKILYWLGLDFRLSTQVARGTLMASAYLRMADPEAHVQPAILYLEGYDAAYVAWARMAEDGIAIDQADPEHIAHWGRLAKGLLNKWHLEIAGKIHKTE